MSKLTKKYQIAEYRTDLNPPALVPLHNYKPFLTRKFAETTIQELDGQFEYSIIELWSTWK